MKVNYALLQQQKKMFRAKFIRAKKREKIYAAKTPGNEILKNKF